MQQGHRLEGLLHLVYESKKLKKANLPPGGQLELRKTVSMAAHSTRTPYPGTHVVDVVVNGRARPIGSFQVVG